MKNVTNIKIPKSMRYLSEFIKELPSNCLINKGVTGCGGTTVELNSLRNSIICVPNISLILSKTKDYPEYFPAYGDFTKSDVINYLNLDYKYKKIIITYDSLSKLLKMFSNNSEINPNFTSYFLLIDEYHILFNQYNFRYSAVRSVLDNFKLFDDYCFMSATPLSKLNILEELEHTPIINYVWGNSVPVNISILETNYISRRLQEEMSIAFSKGYNLHIFFNSLKTVVDIVKKLELSNYRIVCSKYNSKVKYNKDKINYQDITSKVYKFNFYTASCFEGADIYDKVGKTIIISDSNIASTMYDISTLIVQICGRLRDSIYKDEIKFIVNTNTNRYYRFKSEVDFKNYVKEKIRLGNDIVKRFNNYTNPITIKAELLRYHDKIFYMSEFYIVKQDNKLILDLNLEKADIHNNLIVQKIYNNVINVIKEINNTDNKLKTTNYKYNNSREISNTYTTFKEALQKEFEVGKVYDQADIDTKLNKLCNLYDIKYNRYTCSKYLRFNNTRRIINGKARHVKRLLEIKI
jgi:hypothetical protein